MRISVVQTNPDFGRKKKNLDEALARMSSVEADLYVLPELFASGYHFLSAEEVQELAEPFPDGATVQALQNFARERSCYVVFGFAEKAKNAVYNSAAIVGYTGEAGLYRKIHLFDREKLFFAPGDLPFQVFQTPFGMVGIMICFDWYFPESMRTLALRGAQLIAHPSNLVLPNCPDGMKTRSLENRLFAATANRIGTEDRGGIRLTYIGQSQITSARGTVLHRSPADKPDVGVVEIDIGTARDKTLNERNNLLNDRRPSFYQ